MSPINPTLHIVTCVSNPHGWLSRIRLARQSIQSWLSQGAHVTVVECAYGSRNYDLADIAGINHVPVRAHTLAWNKECLLNIGIHRLPADATKIATVDADIVFRNDNWIAKTLAALDIYPVVQPWAHCYDLGPGGSHGSVHTSFGHQWLHGAPVTAPQGSSWGNPYAYPHSGYAWAWQRAFVDLIGGMFEQAGMGSGDHHMALGLVGKVDASFPAGIGQSYKDTVSQWAGRAALHCNGKLGYVDGVIEHDFHGLKTKRKYVDRWGMFLKHDFNPHTDLKKNSHGVIEFAGNKPDLEREFDLYLRDRDEDANS